MARHAGTGLCGAHYAQHRRGRDLAPVRRSPRDLREQAERYLAAAERASGGCLLYAGPTSRAGYGVGSYRGRSMLAHRVVYEGLHGPVMPGLHVCHRHPRPDQRERRNCIAPAHLRVGSAGDNAVDRRAADRRAGGSRPNLPRCPRGLDATGLAAWLLDEAARDQRGCLVTPRRCAGAAGYITAEGVRYRILDLILEQRAGRLRGPGEMVCHYRPDGARCSRGCIDPEHLAVGDARVNRRHASILGERDKLTPAAVRDIRRERADGATMLELAGRYGVGDSTVQALLSGRTWGWVGG